jgi:hypothetical protein
VKTTTDMLQAIMSGLVKVLPDCSITLLVAPFGGKPGQRVNYVSNSDRGDMIAMMREVLARFEGRAHDAPESKQ